VSVFTTIRLERPGDRVARIALARPEARNAQSVELLYELNDAFDQLAADDEVSVIVLAADGPHFSSGHDLRDADWQTTLQERRTVGTWCGFTCAGAAGVMAREREIYLGLSERWRNLPKPTIAQVQGKVIAGGLMLVWPCDLIVCSSDAEFGDNTITMGMPGAEWFAHPWELGARAAKEALFTARMLTAADAHRLGMVNHVVPREELEHFTLVLAEQIARQPLFALQLAKESVNAAQDAQGRGSAMATAFAHHQLAHSHNMQVHGSLVDPSFLQGSLSKADRQL
jgi:enoyl-CoA hydratase